MCCQQPRRGTGPERFYKNYSRIDGRAALPRGLGGGAPPPHQSNLAATTFIDPLSAGQE